MGRKKKSGDGGLLTPLELEIMTVLWKLGEGSVHDVLKQLDPDKEYAYNTVSTILRLLLAKGVVDARAEGRGHFYLPVLDKQEYEARTLKHVVSTVFDGEPTSLLRRLLDDQSLSKQTLEELRSLIARKGEK